MSHRRKEDLHSCVCTLCSRSSTPPMVTPLPPTPPRCSNRVYAATRGTSRIYRTSGGVAAQNQMLNRLVI